MSNETLCPTRPVKLDDVELTFQAQLENARQLFEAGTRSSTVKVDRDRPMFVTYLLKAMEIGQDSEVTTLNSQWLRCFNAIARKSWKHAEDMGFHDTGRDFGTEIALMHSELSEALEAHRNRNPISEAIGDGGHTHLDEELADLLIRLMDTAIQHSLDIAGATLAKMEYNKGRGHRHGGKEY